MKNPFTNELRDTVVALQKKQTKIVATMGPTAHTHEQIRTLSLAGMNVARLNFSHGDHESQREVIHTVRSVVQETGKRIAILQDLGGPKIRTGELKDEIISLIEGEQICLTTEEIVGDASRMSISYKELAQDIQVGAAILINDGKIRLEVTGLQGEEIMCVVIVGGEMRSRRGVNLPGTSLSISALTDKDKLDVKLGIEEQVDFMALSFVQSARDIEDLKMLLNKAGSKAMVVAKIETTDAIENMDDIIHAADAVMVARGDLAVEVGPERVPMLQKQIIKKCNYLGKPVIVATQMLESMIESPVPTRAEVSDVSNAILDGADAVMLSQETAYGKYPETVVAMMNNIAQETERSINYMSRLQKRDLTTETNNMYESIARHAVAISVERDAAAIVALTETGSTARNIVRFRSGKPVLVISPHEHVLNQALLSFGAYPALGKTNEGEAVDCARKHILEREMGKPGDTVIMTSGSIFNRAGQTNTITAVGI